MATLEKLPFDILLELLYTSQSVRDLHSLALSSRSLYSAFQEYRFRITLSVLKAELGGPAANYRQLLAIPNAPNHEELINSPIRGGELYPLAVLRPFLDHYFSAQPFDDPIDLKNLEPILQIQKSVTDLTELYFSRTARGQLHSLGGSSDGPVHPLSRTERTRIHRAFLRYELYTRIFPYDQAQRWKLTVVSAFGQLHAFIWRMRRWEVEEILTIHEFLVSLMKDVLVDAEEQLVEMFLTCPGGWRPPTTTTTTTTTTTPAPPSRSVHHSGKGRKGWEADSSMGIAQDLPPSKCVRLTAPSGMERYESIISIKDQDLVRFYDIPKGYEDESEWRVDMMKCYASYLTQTLGLTALSTLVLHHGSGTDQRRILRGAGLEPGVLDYLEADWFARVVAFGHFLIDRGSSYGYGNGIHVDESVGASEENPSQLPSAGYRRAVDCPVLKKMGWIFLGSGTADNM